MEKSVCAGPMEGDSAANRDCMAASASAAVFGGVPGAVASVLLTWPLSNPPSPATVPRPARAADAENARAIGLVVVAAARSLPQALPTGLPMRRNAESLRT